MDRTSNEFYGLVGTVQRDIVRDHQRIIRREAGYTGPIDGIPGDETVERYMRYLDVGLPAHKYYALVNELVNLEVEKILSEKA